MCGRYALTLGSASAIPAAVQSNARWADPGDAHAYVPRNTVNPTTHAPVAFRQQPPPQQQPPARSGGGPSGGRAAAARGRPGQDDAAGDGHREPRFTSAHTTVHDDNDQNDQKECSRAPAARDGDVVVRFMRWGLVPSYMQRSQITQNPPLINARSETVLEKPSFRAIRAKTGSRRCVVITSGYYEWFSYPDPPGPARGRPPPKKLPYLVHADQAIIKPADSMAKQEQDGDTEHDKPGPKPLLLAGLYDLWNGDAGEADRTGDVGWSFAIVTMDSNPQISWLHSRMPVVLETEHAVRTWLDASCPPDKACDIAVAESNRTKRLAWTRMVKDLSAPLPPDEQGKPKPPPKLAAIESFFSSPGSKSGRRRGKASASAEETEATEDMSGDPENLMNSGFNSVNTEGGVEPPAKRSRKESDAPSLKPPSHENPDVPIVGSSIVEEQKIVSPLPKGYADRKQVDGQHPNSLSTARPRVSPKKPKDGKQRSIAEFFKPK
jgi:putative SOS response-associated peptidase YedK